METNKIKTRNLPRWAKTQQLIINSYWKKSIETLTFDGMDWAYGKWLTKDWDIVNFNADFVKNWDFYDII